ncbi:MAG TPA: TetR/AcrR family transcriptional regulator [Terriglobales bacterium]
MSRTADAHLADRILDVALTLLRLRGEDGVTLRAVAEAAGTTTPTIYKRYRDKEALMVALALRERDKYVKRQSRQKTLEAAIEGYLDWATDHPHEYWLIYGPKWPRVLSDERGRPGLEWTDQQLAKRFGGKPEQYRVVTTALWLLLHGAASLITQQANGDDSSRIREESVAACRRVLLSAKILRDGLH